MERDVTVPVVTFATSLKIFAQTGTTVDPGLGTLLGNVGVIGALVWYLWYQTAKSEPKKIERFLADRAEDRKAFTAELAALRVEFATEQAALRATFATEQQALRDANAKETRELRSMLIETMKSMRTAVHDVKDTAQVAITKAAVADEQQRQQRNADTKG